MKRYRFIIAAIMLTGFVASASDQDPEQKGQMRPDSLVVSKTVQWKEAYNSGDAANLVPLYASDARYISSHVPGLLADGRERVISNFQAGMNSGGHIDSIEIIRTEASCDLATLFCRYQATNNGVTVVGRNLLIMKRINGEWMIILHMTVV